jgi:serine/threonine protein kinase
VKFLSELNHENIVKLYGFILRDNTPEILMEYAGKKKTSPCHCMLMYFVFMLQCQKVQNNCKILLKSNMVVTTTQSFYTGTNEEKINSSLH